MNEQSGKNKRVEITAAMIEEWVKKIKDLDPNPANIRLKKKEAVEKALTAITQAMKRGCDLESIAATASSVGFDISPGSLKSTMSALRKEKKQAETPPPAPPATGEDAVPTPKVQAPEKTPVNNNGKAPNATTPPQVKEKEKLSRDDLGSEVKPGGHPFVKDRGDLD